MSNSSNFAQAKIIYRKIADHRAEQYRQRVNAATAEAAALALEDSIKDMKEMLAWATEED